MARRFATRIGAIRANRFARIDSQKKKKKPIFITFAQAKRSQGSLKPCQGGDPLLLLCCFSASALQLSLELTNAGLRKVSKRKAERLYETKFEQCQMVVFWPRQTKPKKAPKRKFMNFAHFCEFWCFSLGKQARFTFRTFVPECPCEKFMTWPFFGLICWGHSWFSLRMIWGLWGP